MAPRGAPAPLPSGTLLLSFVLSIRFPASRHNFFQTLQTPPTRLRMTHDHPPARETLQMPAGVLAFLLPGAGHLYLGEKKRAIAIMVGVLSLFFGGILIGGVDVVDREEDFWWFLPQAAVGPIAFTVDFVHQRHLKLNDPPANETAEWFIDNPPRRIKSLGHLNEIGSLYATIAGMLNAICIIDALWHAPPRRRRTGVVQGRL